MARSIQPAYQKGSDNISSAFRQYILSVKDMLEEMPKYKADTRKRDIRLRQIARSENILQGILSTVVSRNANRSFSLVGGSRQVSKYSNILHNVNNGQGWTDFVTKTCQGYYTTNFGYGAEIALDKKVPSSLYSFDSTRCKLLGNGGDTNGNTLYSYPSSGKIQKYKLGEYIHDNSMTSIEFELKNAGMCAVERCLTAARIMAGVMQYYLDKVNVAPSQGIVHFRGISMEDFDKAVGMAEEEKKSLGADVYNGVMALFTEETTSDIQLTSFSSLPENFQYKDFIEVILQIYSLAFNFPVGQFWSISSGSFGRTGEMEVQEQMATEKGELEFAISLQEQLHRWFLPDALTFKFDIRNDSGDLIKEKVRTERINQAKELVGSGILSIEEARILLAESGDIPQQWAESINNDVEGELAIVREGYRKMAMENSDMIARMINVNEPIIRYTHNPIDDLNIFDSKASNETIQEVYKNKFPRGSIDIVFEDLETARRKRNF